MFKHALLVAILLATISSSIFGQRTHAAFPKDLRGIIHCHSELSYDSRGKLSDIEKAAAAKDVDFVIMTDHWSPTLYERSWRGFHGKILFIAGAELSKHNDMSLLVFPLPRNFVPGGQQEINREALERLGATVFAGHIELAHNDRLLPFEGIELTNLHAQLLKRSIPNLVWSYFRLFAPHNWDLAFLVGTVKTLPRWYELEARKGAIVPGLAGNDTHDNVRLFQLFGPKMASYKRTFGLITTHVWADSLSEESVIEAVKRGQSYIAFEVFGGSDGFRFYVENGEEIFLPGSKVERKDKSQKLKIVVKLPDHLLDKHGEMKFAHGVMLQLIKDGKPLDNVGGSGISGRAGGISGAQIGWEITDPGIYRVEITKNGKLWIVSNAIAVQ